MQRKLKSALLNRIIPVSFQKYYMHIQYPVEIDNIVISCSAN